MTEAEWLGCNDPDKMLRFVQGKASERQLRLLACACCRSLDRHGNVTGLAAVELAEQAADGLLPPGEAARRASAVYRLITDEWALDLDPARAARKVACGGGLWGGARPAALVRDVFGNPFRLPPPLAATWLAWDGGVVTNLAQTIYEERAFGRLPILADALEDAGCTSEELLAHCRAGVEHVRGCWAVDLVLGKE
jgi:hypothetical protein